MKEHYIKTDNNFKIRKKSLNKLDKLKSRKVIETLFREGVSNKAGCLQLVFIDMKEFDFPKVLFSVPKSKISKAYMRNTLKRRMREIYRINKDKLQSESGYFKIALCFIFIHKVECNYATIENSILEHMQWIKNKLTAQRS